MRRGVVVVVDALVSQAGKEQGIAVGVAMVRGSGEARTGSYRWLGHDAEQRGGATMVRLQRGEATSGTSEGGCEMEEKGQPVAASL